ncbi:hypothetical protein [Mycobacterium sp.]|uniref:hypothetical protein n=1 Tax=Mycobacterium sp. TaxID=1785 RepID=UPI003A89C013
MLLDPAPPLRSHRDDEYLSHRLDQGYAIVGTDNVGPSIPGVMSYLNSAASAHAVVKLGGPDLAIPEQFGPVADSYTVYISGTVPASMKDPTPFLRTALGG